MGTRKDGTSTVASPEEDNTSDVEEEFSFVEDSPRTQTSQPKSQPGSPYAKKFITTSGGGTNVKEEGSGHHFSREPTEEFTFVEETTSRLPCSSLASSTASTHSSSSELSKEESLVDLPAAKGRKRQRIFQRGFDEEGAHLKFATPP